MEMPGKRLERRDRWMVGLLIAATLGLVVAAPVIGGILGSEAALLVIGILQIAVLAALLFGIVRGTDLWTGELARLILLGAIAGLMVLFGDLLSFVAHYVLESQGIIVLGASWEFWHNLGRLIGVGGFALAAYMFYEFSKAPWFPGRTDEGDR